jgi:hypothetical protein
VLTVAGAEAAGKLTLKATDASDSTKYGTAVINVSGETQPVAAALNSVTANSDSTATTTALTLTFSAAIAGLTADDISISAASGSTASINKGTLSGSGPAYTLPVTVSAGGKINVSVSKEGYVISPASKEVTVYYVAPATPVTLSSVSANGTANTTATTALTLTFNKAVAGLTANNITLNPGTTGAQKGTLSGSGTSWTLGVSGITADGQVTVSVSSQPTGYNITGSPSTTVYKGVTAVTMTVTPNGNSTTTTTALTLGFSSPGISGLAAGDIMISDTGNTGAAKGALSGATTSYTLGLSGITAGGSITVSVNKNGYRVEQKVVTVYYYYDPSVYTDPGTGANGSKSLKQEFNVTSTGTTGVKDTFNAVSAFIKDNSLNNQTKIELGDYIDLEGGLTIAAYGSGSNTGAISISSGTGQGQASWRITTTSSMIYNPNYESVYLRLIVVGISSFNGKNGNDKRHIVFQFQNIPVERRMNESNTSSGGYASSEMMTYLTNNFLPGLTSAGVPEGVLWAPKRKMAAEYSGSGTTRIEDKLWLPTEREMFGRRDYSNNSAETDGNQGRFDYYYNGDTNNFARRVKYSSGGLNSSGVPTDSYGYGKWYWEASSYSAVSSSFCNVDTNGSTYCDSAGGCAPAFCVAY